MKRKPVYGILVLFLIVFQVKAQNTVGVLLNTEKALDGYVLYTAKTETYMIDNCGQVVNRWSSAYPSGKSVYLLENGNLLRTAEIENPGDLEIPGRGGRVELYDWDGNLLWSFNYGDAEKMQHHDIYPLPNGNILLLAITEIPQSEAIQLGRDPSKLPQNRLYNEQIVEIEPVGTDQANIVWEWNVKDHLIQDFDSTKDNFGVIAEHPERLDINFLGISGDSQNWLHFNSIQYNAQLDQIIISCRMLSELYIIDHSTTTAEASGSTGGLYGKGGDFLYRWGNPQVYDHGSGNSQKLFGQHYPHWIPENLPDGGKIMLFNNGINRPGGNYSEVLIIDPPQQTPGFYTYTTGTAYGPTQVDYSYTAPNKSDFSSNILSSAQRLENGNIFICEGTKGHLFEIDQNEDIVWEYINPVSNNGILNQGDDPSTVTNMLFRGTKFAKDYQAFQGRDLTPELPVEGNPDLSQCEILGVEDTEAISYTLYPNPAHDMIWVRINTDIEHMALYDITGKRLLENKGSNSMALDRIPSGLYFLKITTGNGIFIKRLLIKNR